MRLLMASRCRRRSPASIWFGCVISCSQELIGLAFVVEIINAGSLSWIFWRVASSRTLTYSWDS